MQTIKLKKPIEFGSDTITELNLREPTLGDLQGINLEEMMLADNVMAILSRISGVSLAAIKKLSFQDLAPVSALLGSFFASENQPLNLQEQQ